MKALASGLFMATACKNRFPIVSRASIRSVIACLRSNSFSASVGSRSSSISSLIGSSPASHDGRARTARKPFGVPFPTLRAAALSQGDGCRAPGVRGQENSGVNSISRLCASRGSGLGDLVRTMPSLGVSSLDLPRREPIAPGPFWRLAVSAPGCPISRRRASAPVAFEAVNLDSHWTEMRMVRLVCQHHDRAALRTIVDARPGPPPTPSPALRARRAVWAAR